MESSSARRPARETLRPIPAKASRPPQAISRDDSKTDKRTQLVGSPLKCGWPAVQTKGSIAARILLRLPQAGKAKGQSALGQFPINGFICVGRSTAGTYPGPEYANEATTMPS